MNLSESKPALARLVSVFVCIPLLIADFPLSLAASSKDKEQGSLWQRKSCCRSYRQIRYENLDSAETVEFDFNEKSQVYRFSSGKSYIKAFRLPEYNKPYVINIHSFIVKSSLTKRNTLVKPMFMFLDKRYRTTRIEEINLPKKGNAQRVKDNLEGTVEVGEKNRKDRYLILYTTDEVTRTSFHYRKPHTLVPVHVGRATTVVNVKAIDKSVPFGYEGKLNLSILFQ